jgi:endoglucanase
MRNAMPGDVIAVAPGMYTGPAVTIPVHSNSGMAPVTFQASNPGTMAAPIVVTAQDPSNPPVLVGQGPTTGSGYVVHIGADYWHLQNLIVTSGQKGIIYDIANYGYICGVEVYNMGDEAIHIRDGSAYFAVEGVNDHDTGVGQPQYSEGFYCGSFASSDPNFNVDVHDVTIKNSILGPNVPTKLVNFQPGSHNNTVDSCQLIGAGGTGINGGQAFISNKGMSSVFQNSTFHHMNATARTTDILDELGGNHTGSGNMDAP